MSQPSLDRRSFLGSAAVAGMRPDVALAEAACSGLFSDKGWEKLSWVGSYPGRVVLDDAPLFVAENYFATWFGSDEMNRWCQQTRASGAGAGVRLVAEDKIAMGVASPLEFLFALEQGMPVVSIAQHMWREPHLLVKPKNETNACWMVPSPSLQPVASMIAARMKKPEANICDSRDLGQEKKIQDEEIDWIIEARENNCVLISVGLEARVKAADATAEILSPHPTDDYIDRPGGFLVANRNALDEPKKREQLEQLLRAWISGLRFAMLNPEAAAFIASENVDPPLISAERRQIWEEQKEQDQEHKVECQDAGERDIVQRALKGFIDMLGVQGRDRALTRWGQFDKAGWDALRKDAECAGISDGRDLPEGFFTNDLVNRAMRYKKNLVAASAQAEPVHPCFKK